MVSFFSLPSRYYYTAPKTEATAASSPSSSSSILASLMPPTSRRSAPNYLILSPASHGEEAEEADTEDKMPIIMERCGKTAECKPVKKRWDRCTERLSDGEPHEDHHGHPETCIEEMFDTMNW